MTNARDKENRINNMARRTHAIERDVQWEIRPSHVKKKVTSKSQVSIIIKTQDKTTGSGGTRTVLKVLNIPKDVIF